MRNQDLTHATLQRELTGLVLQHVFCGPLLLIWAIGLAIIVVVFERAGVGLVWSGVVLALGLFMAADYLRAPRVRERLIRSIVPRRFSASHLVQSSLESAVEKAMGIFTEITLKVDQYELQKHSDVHLRRLIPLTDRMITLLHESVGHADELVRALNLAQESMAESAVQQASKPESKSIGHRGSLENIRHEAERAHSSVHAIVEQLQSLFLKVLQHNPDAGRNAELVREAEEILTRMTHQIQLRCTDWCVSMGTQDKEANLETGFLQVNSADGLRTLQRLIAEYGGLRHLLEGDSGAQSISGAQISLLAQETYRVGLDLLQDALELLRAIDPLKKHRLEMEVRELDIKLVALRTGNAEDERVKLMEATKKSHLERLDIMQNQQLRIEELLHLSGRCEATLQCARIEITALKTADSGLNVEQATESLRKTIERAREVQEELKRLSL